MKSLRDLYRIGNGPSSSHTMAPKAASLAFARAYPDALALRVTLYDSLAATGRGHLTDKAILDALHGKAVEIIWKPDEELPLHTNGMRFEALDAQGKVIGSVEEYSVGGGALLSDVATGNIYKEQSATEIMDVVERDHGTLWEYIEKVEGPGISEYLLDVWHVMDQAIDNGLKNKGTIPGPLKLPRKAHAFYTKSSMLEIGLKNKIRLSAYAYAVSEENASGGLIVTAPTCGSCGVVPAVLRSLQKHFELSEEALIHALGVAGLFGNIVKTNASISGARVGCQGEVGTACAMAAAAACHILGGTPKQIGYAAEMGMEHHLGLSCDPVLGLVQIPCIERNAHAALRALDCAHFAILSDGTHRISFDDVVAVMYETGGAMSRDFKETSRGGLAKVYQRRIESYIEDVQG